MEKLNYNYTIDSDSKDKHIAIVDKINEIVDWINGLESSMKKGVEKLDKAMAEKKQRDEEYTKMMDIIMMKR